MLDTPSRFHEDDYDGIVLKIPSWFIKMNNLQDVIADIHSKLEACRLSSYHPDHVSNLVELSEYEVKATVIKEAKDQLKKTLERKEKIQELCFSGDIFEVSWQKELAYIDADDYHLTLNGKDWDREEIFTKYGVSAAFAKSFKETIKSVQDLKEFANSNYFGVQNLKNLVKGLTDYTARIETLNLGQSTQGWNQLIISFDVLTAKFGLKRTKKNIYAHTGKVIVNQDGVIGIDVFHKDYMHLNRLDGFKIIPRYLVPEKFNFNTLTYKQ